MARSGQTYQDLRKTDVTDPPEAAPPIASTATEIERSITISNMTYSEMVGFYHQQLARVELAWFRIMYLHAAIVGVLIFFGEAEDFLILQRFIVFGFFTVNLVIFHVALSEGYEGLSEAQKDLKRFPENDGHVDRWFRKRENLYKTGVRTAIMAVTWVLVGFLLFQSPLFG